MNVYTDGKVAYSLYKNEHDFLDIQYFRLKAVFNVQESRRTMHCCVECLLYANVRTTSLLVPSHTHPTASDGKLQISAHARSNPVI